MGTKRQAKHIPKFYFSNLLNDKRQMQDMGLPGFKAINSNEPEWVPR